MSGMYYKNSMIINDTSRVVWITIVGDAQVVASPMIVILMNL